MIYSIRESVFDQSTVYELTKDGLTLWRAGRDERTIPFDAVRSLHLKYNGLGWYVCVLRTASQKVVLTNQHYVRYGKYDDRSVGYTAFLEILHSHLEPHAASIRFTKGSHLLWWLGAMLLVVLPLLSTAAFMLMTNGRISPTLNLRMALALIPLALTGIAWPLFKKGCAKQYSPDSLPPELVPEIVGEVC